jgi:hypothetical protein
MMLCCFVEARGTMLVSNLYRVTFLIIIEEGGTNKRYDRRLVRTVRGQLLVQEGDLEPLGSRWLFKASTVCLNESSAVPNAVEEMKSK